VKTVRSEQWSVLSRHALPREFDQASQAQRPMVNPALGVYSRAPLEEPTKCCVQFCGRAAVEGAFCWECYQQYEAYNRLWARQAARRNDPRRQARRAWYRRFAGGFMILASLELLIGYCIHAPVIWQSIALGFAWSVLIGAINASFGTKRGGGLR
jgi:hypothetical protein